MSKRDVQYEDFECTKMGTIVYITRTILINRSARTGDIDSQHTIKLDCNHKSDCGVGESSGRSTTYDWNKCVYPNSKP